MRTITASVQLENKITGRESQGACRQDELIGGKPPVVVQVCHNSDQRGLRHELSLGWWVRIPLKAWMSVYAFILCLCCPVYT
jgi:hypothetical protein